MPRTVMLIEDEPDLRLMERLQLELAGYRVVEADSAEDALSLLEAAEPDAILLDLGLPGMDGWELLSRLREAGRFPRIPVIVVSAHASPGRDAEAFRMGCRGYITKPFSLTALGTTLESILEPDR